MAISGTDLLELPTVCGKRIFDIWRKKKDICRTSWDLMEIHENEWNAVVVCCCSLEFGTESNTNNPYIAIDQWALLGNYIDPPLLFFCRLILDDDQPSLVNLEPMDLSSHLKQAKHAGHTLVHGDLFASLKHEKIASPTSKLDR